jgi:1-acyl-sn-glycerol-3-phosphate acyltransferase
VSAVVVTHEVPPLASSGGFFRDTSRAPGILPSSLTELESIMPLPPLRDPDELSQRVLATARTAPIAGFLVGSLLGLNAAQTLSTALLPFAPKAFRRFNRWAANTWWGWCVTGSRVVNDAYLEVTGDDVPMRENAIVVVNHQNMPDITWLLDFARQKDRLGDLKWIVKDPIKYVPGVGWGMLFLDCVFVKRDWMSDQASIRRTFAKLRDDDIPVWLVSFSEGTRITPEKLAASQAYAREHGLFVPRHVLIPRTKGFAATVQGLRDHVAAVYDLTLGYEGSVPTLGQFIKGYAPRAHLHVRRHAIETLPADDEGIGAWLLARFQEKDERLERFYQTGRFEP